jgi:hypothetical protein
MDLARAAVRGIMKKKLKLNRVTVRELSTRNLIGAPGGRIYNDGGGSGGTVTCTCAGNTYCGCTNTCGCDSLGNNTNTCL